MDVSEVDWSKEEHAYGSAEDVPTLLKELEGSDSAERRRALGRLSQAINHQGWASPVARRVVPFLLQILSRAKTKGDKTRLLVLLGNLAPGGNHDSFMSAGYGELWGSLSLSAPLDPELCRAVAEGRPLFLDLLHDRASEVRAASAFVLGMLGPSEESYRDVEARLHQEGDPSAQASLLLALGLLAQALKKSDCVDEILPRQESSVPAVVVAAEGALSWVAPTRAQASVLLDWAEKGLVDRVVPFWDGNLGLGALRLAVRTMLATEAFPDLERFLTVHSQYPGSGALNQLTSMVVQSAKQAPCQPRHLAELRPLEKAFLERISQNENLTSQLRHVLRAGGIMYTSSSVQRLLHPNPTDVMERLVDDAPLWKHAFRVLGGTASLADWDAALAHLSNKERFQLCVDLGKIPYDLDRQFQDASWRPGALADLLVHTARSGGLQATVLAEQVSNQIAALLVVGLMPEGEERLRWSLAHLDLVENACNVAPTQVRPLLVALPLEERASIVRQLTRRACLELADLAPTPLVAAEIADTAELAAEHEYRAFDEEFWKKLLSHFGPDSLSVLEHTAHNPEVPIRHLFAGAVARLRGVPSSGTSRDKS